MTKFEPERFLKVLVDESLDFVRVGGYAALLQGATRPTQDVDIEALTELYELLRRAGDQPPDTR